MKTLLLRQPPGDLAVWFFIAAEMTVFALLFICFAVALLIYPNEFRHGLAHLDLATGLANTLILLTSSFTVACALQLFRSGRIGKSLLALLATMTLGLAYMVLKLREYGASAAAGYRLDTDTFSFFYYFTTSFHLLHVLLGIIVLAVVARRLQRQGRAYSETELESAASYWHMLDLLWLVLFALLYLPGGFHG